MAVSGDDKSRLEALNERLGYAFKDNELLRRALTHTSWRNESVEEIDNERLEFLGDAVLELVVSDMLFHRLPDVDEGPLTQWRALLVNTNKLAEVAENLGLGPCLLLGVGEEKSGGRTRASNLANAMEAVVGAIYIDGGFDEAKRVVQELLDAPLSQLSSSSLKDPRSRLQEWSQAATGAIPRYKVSEESHSNLASYFAATVQVGKVHAEGTGKTKKEAIHEAARQALSMIDLESKAGN
jgi:ribonuclease III